MVHFQKARVTLAEMCSMDRVWTVSEDLLPPTLSGSQVDGVGLTQLQLQWWPWLVSKSNPGKVTTLPLLQCWLHYQFSHSVVSDSLWPHGLQDARLPCPSPTPRAYSNSCPSSQWCHPTISYLCRPLLLLPPIPPSIRVSSLHQVAKVLELQLQPQSFQWTRRTYFL